MQVESAIKNPLDTVPHYCGVIIINGERFTNWKKRTTGGCVKHSTGHVNSSKRSTDTSKILKKEKKRSRGRK